jgi:hypothetical protein
MDGTEHPVEGSGRIGLKSPRKSTVAGLEEVQVLAIHTVVPLPCLG